MSFDELFDRYKKPLMGYVFHLTGDGSLAQEIFQDTFLKAIENRDKFRKDEEFSPWIFTIARNLTRDTLRKKGRKPVVSLDDEALMRLSSLDSEPDEQTLRDLDAQEIRRAVNGLPEPQRDIVLLKYASGLSFQELAKIRKIRNQPR